MRIFVVGAAGAIGARLATQHIDHRYQVVGAHRSPRNAGRVRGLSPESEAVGQPACVRPRSVGSF